MASGPSPPVSEPIRLPRSPKHVGIGLGVALAAVAVMAIALSAGGGGSDRAAGIPRPSPPPPSPAALARARGQVLTVLHRYERAFSHSDVTGLASLFAPDVFRHGIRGGGCAETRGRQAVAQTYEETFASGTGRYRLTGLSPRSINVTGPIAWVNSHYEIATRSGSSAGTVSFELRRSTPAWLIAQIVASC